MHFLEWYLFVAPHALLGLLLALVVRRGLRKQFPIFVSYIVFELTYFLALTTFNLLILYSLASLVAYRWVLVVGLGISAVLEIGVLYELANELILSHSTLAEYLRPLLRWAAGLLLVVAPASALLTRPGTERVMSAFQVLNFSSSALQVGLLAVLILFSHVLRVAWRSFPVGIAVGFAISGVVELSASALLSAFGSRGYVAIDVARMAAFHVTVLIWLFYLLLPEREPKFAGKLLQKSELEFWDQELQRMVQR